MLNILADAVTTNSTVTMSAIEVGLAAGGAAIGIGAIGAGVAQAIGRNPGAVGAVLPLAFIFVGISEGTFIIVAFLLAK
jgi:F0F1-type ATP synthase membrane subunit c/vacuolar-type H+-ATPase subunit K